MFGSDLPRSASDRLVVYLLGPGFGESVVVVVPDGRVLVADACVSGGQNLPRALLTALGLASITLLAITHPDLDHIEGVAELLTTYRPSRVWTFPLSATFRDAVARRARALGEPRLAARPLPGHPARPIYEPVGKGDKYFPTVVYDAMALAYENQLAGPEVWSTMREAISLRGADGFATYPVSQNKRDAAGKSQGGSVEFSGWRAQLGVVTNHLCRRDKPVMWEGWHRRRNDRERPASVVGIRCAGLAEGGAPATRGHEAHRISQRTDPGRAGRSLHLNPCPCPG